MADLTETIAKLVDYQKVSYLSSVDADGYPQIRALLQPRRHDGIKTFWFSTNTSSSKVGQFLANPKAGLYFCDRRFFRGVLFLGTVAVLHDPEVKQELWEVGDTRYYPQGVTDPDYCVLRFDASSARIYSSMQTRTLDIA